MWRHMQDGLLQLYMLKRNRRGAYANGATNADTFWPAVQPRATTKHCNLLQCMHQLLPAHVHHSICACLCNKTHCTDHDSGHQDTMLCAGTEEACTNGTPTRRVPSGALLRVSIRAARRRAWPPQHRPRKPAPQADD